MFRKAINPTDPVSLTLKGRSTLVTSTGGYKMFTHSCSNPRFMWFKKKWRQDLWFHNFLFHIYVRRPEMNTLLQHLCFLLHHLCLYGWKSVSVAHLDVKIFAPNRKDCEFQEKGLITRMIEELKSLIEDQIIVFFRRTPLSDPLSMNDPFYMRQPEL